MKNILKKIDEIFMAYNTGKIDNDEFRRKGARLWRAYKLPQLLEYAHKKEWEKFTEMALCVYEVMPDAFKHYDEIPDRLKYNFAVDAYVHHGDSVPAVRAAVRNALKYGKPKLPQSIAKKDVITVYRAGEEPIEKAKYRISWTTKRKVAEWFFYEYSKRACHLYRAQIKTEDIIAYTNCRKENEVMQYRKVFNIEEITTKGGNV